VAPEINGRVIEVLVEEGQSVKQGELLVKLDSTLAEAQFQQAHAAAWAAQANADAARANYELLLAGASREQLAVAQAGVDTAQVNVDAAQDAYDNIPENLVDTEAGKTARLQLDRALAAQSAAQANYDLVKAGARPEQIAAAAALSTAAAAQQAAAEAALQIASTQLERFTITAPMDGVILERAIQPGEFITPGGTLLVLADLSRLTLTLYVPEDQYGRITLGQEFEITVDSFPNQAFTGVVSYISDQAEFTPRNVQTIASRKLTVYAVRLTIANNFNRLKQGMPANIYFGQ